MVKCLLSRFSFLLKYKQSLVVYGNHQTHSYIAETSFISVVPNFEVTKIR